MPTPPDDMDHLLKTLRDTAREEERADQAALGDPAGAPALDAAARERIARVILAAPAEVVSLDQRRRARRRWAGLLVVPLAAAASALLVARPHPPGPLPAYELVATGGVREERGTAETSGPVQRLSPQSILDVKLRPAIGVEGPVVTGAVLLRGDRVWPVSLDTQLAPSGAVSLRAEGRTFADRCGACQLRIVVARPALEKQLGSLALEPATSGPGWQRFSVPIEIAP